MLQFEVLNPNEELVSIAICGAATCGLSWHRVATCAAPRLRLSDHLGRQEQ